MWFVIFVSEKNWGKRINKLDLSTENQRLDNSVVEIGISLNRKNLLHYIISSFDMLNPNIITFWFHLFAFKLLFIFFCYLFSFLLPLKKKLIHPKHKSAAIKIKNIFLLACLFSGSIGSNMYTSTLAPIHGSKNFLLLKHWFGTHMHFLYFQNMNK